MLASMAPSLGRVPANDFVTAKSAIEAYINERIGASSYPVMRNKSIALSSAKWLIPLAFAVTCSAVGAARAADGASQWFETDQGRVRLVAAAPRVGDGDRIELGLDFRLAPHWKIYWRSPGDAGYPPRLDWTGSTNLGATTMAWPAPDRKSTRLNSSHPSIS